MAIKLTKRKGFNFFRSYYDVYNELETNEDKVAFIDALLDRQFLGIKPTELKGMAKFAYISQTNSIDSQVKGFEDKTGIILTPTQGGSIEGLATPTGQVEVKEKVEVEVKEKVEVEVKEKVEVEIKNITALPTFSFYHSLIKSGGKDNLVSDWLKVRKTKRATNTETAFKKFISELEKSKHDINDVLIKCIENSWSGFNSDWYNKNNTKVKPFFDSPA